MNIDKVRWLGKHRFIHIVWDGYKKWRWSRLGIDIDPFDSGTFFRLHWSKGWITFKSKWIVHRHYSF